MTLKSEATYPTRRTLRLEVCSEAGREAFAGPMESSLSQPYCFTARQVLLDSIARDLEGSGNPLSVDPTDSIDQGDGVTSATERSVGAKRK